MEVTIERFAEELAKSLKNDGFDKVSVKDLEAVAKLADSPSRMTEDQYSLQSSIGSAIKNLQK